MESVRPTLRSGSVYLLQKNVIAAGKVSKKRHPRDHSIFWLPSKPHFRPRTLENSTTLLNMLKLIWSTFICLMCNQNNFCHSLLFNFHTSHCVMFTLWSINSASLFHAWTIQFITSTVTEQKRESRKKFELWKGMRNFSTFRFYEWAFMSIYIPAEKKETFLGKKMWIFAIVRYGL